MYEPKSPAWAIRGNQPDAECVRGAHFAESLIGCGG
jgi:hypothetical protein